MTIKRSWRARSLALLGAAAGVALALSACSSPAPSAPAEEESVAATLPSGTLTMVTPYGAGGTTDLTARSLAAGMEASLGQTVIVENLPGASGITGTAKVATAKADGSTLLFAVDNVFIQSVLRDAPYTFDSFVGVRGFFAQPYLLVVSADSPYQSVADLEKAGKINYGTSGWANEQHLDNAILFEQLGVEAAAVPFDGNGPATQALIGDNVDVLLSDAQPLMPFVDSGDVRVLAVLSPTGERLDYLPEVPTLEEDGVDTSEMMLPTWGFALPAGASEGIVAAWDAEIMAAAETPEFQEFAELNYLILIDDAEAVTWFEDARESAQAYVDLLERFNITLQ